MESDPISSRINADTGRSLEGYRHILGAAKLKHIFDAHGDPSKEAKQGQRAVTESDIERLDSVVADYADVSVSEKTANGGLEVLEFIKRFEDGEFHYKVEIRKGRKHLAPATLFIKI